MQGRYLRPTPLLDYEHPSIRALVAERSWTRLPEPERIGAIYEFVRDEIPFGYSASDDRPASAVLADGYGQCNTKTTLLMALLRATGTACRLHGATVDKELLKGLTGAFHHLVPRSVTHAWAEVFYDARWVGLEGVIVDQALLDGLRRHLRLEHGPFLGYALGTEDVANPPVDWQGTDTFIQSSAVDHDLGVFDDPDGFFRVHPSTSRGLHGWLFRHRAQGLMNQRVESIRRAPRHSRAAVAA